MLQFPPCLPFLFYSGVSGYLSTALKIDSSSALSLLLVCRFSTLHGGQLLVLILHPLRVNVLLFVWLWLWQF